MRFIAIASVVCASREIEPNDIAPVEKRLTMSAAGSTSSSGTGLRPSSSAALDAEQAADRQQVLGLLVEQLGVGVVLVARIAAHGVLQQRHRLRRPAMRLAAQAVGVFAADLERRCAAPANRRTRRRAGAPSPRRSRRGRRLRCVVAVPEKNSSTKAFDRPIGVEDLRAAIGLVGRDAHLRHDLEQALVDRLDEALDDLVSARSPRAGPWPSPPASRRRDRG